MPEYEVVVPMVRSQYGEIRLKVHADSEGEAREFAEARVESGAALTIDWQFYSSDDINDTEPSEVTPC